MKRIIAFLLGIALLFTGCTQVTTTSHSESSSSSVEEVVASTVNSVTEEIVWQETIPEFESLDDNELLYYVEDLVYRDTVNALNSDEYFVENVSAVYISKEYLEEVAFNSQSNIYFGLTLAELDEMFEGTRYIFTLGEDGQTTVQELQEIEDNSTETMLKNVAIGSGVILVCVTVSAVTAGAPAVSMIFAASAKTATTMALSSAAFGGISAGVVRGIETGDFSEAVEAAAMGASEGFKWGAISGAIAGGASKAVELKGATTNGLKMNEAAQIQQESGLPLEFIKSFHSMEEYNVYKDAGLQLTKVNGKWAYTQQIDWDLVDPDGYTNYQRVDLGRNPIDATGKSYEVHHIGQMDDSPLALLTQSQHKGNYSTLHQNTGSSPSNIDRGTFDSVTRPAFFKDLRLQQCGS